MATLKMSPGAVVAIAVTGLIITMLTAGLLTSNQAAPSSTVSSSNVGVYTDSDCTDNCTMILWGTLKPGDTANRTVYVKNSGAVPMTLNMSTSSWDPSSADTHLTLSWNRAGYNLSAGSSVSAVFTLAVSASTGNLTTFSFNIAILGTE